MSAKKPTAESDGPDLLARYLHVYKESRQMTDLERPWGLGDDNLGEIWIRLSTAVSTDPQRLNHILASELSGNERALIVRAIVPLLFALPIRVFPAKLSASIRGARMIFKLWHDGKIMDIGFLPSALETDLHDFLKEMLTVNRPRQKPLKEALISVGGRRKRISVILGNSSVSPFNSLLIQFLERLPSPADDR